MSSVKHLMTRTGAAIVAGLSVVTLASAQERIQRPRPTGSTAEQVLLPAPTQNAVIRDRRLMAVQPPANLRVEPQNPLLHKLAWSDPGAGKFRIFRRSASVSTWTLVADAVPGTEYLDRAVVSPGTVYRVEAVYPTGIAAAADIVYQNPLQPPVPQEFRGWQDSSEKVTLRWMHVANATAYRIFGPTLPPEGAFIDMSPYNIQNGGYPINHSLFKVPPGTHTFSIASVFGDAGYSLDGMPSATVAATARRGRYRISVTGFRATQATNDDPVFHRDGKGDEIFIAAFVGSDLGGVGRLDRKIVRSRVYGDVNHFPDRIQAGSSSPYGGIGPGNAVPATAGALLPSPVAATPDRLPLLVWEGELWDGDLGLAVVPTIWEWDGDDKNYRDWSGWLMGTRYDWHEVLTREMKSEPIRMYGIGPKLGPETFGVRMDDSFGKDLPIGYFNIGMVDLLNASRPSYSSSAYLIGRGTIERTLGSNQAAVIKGGGHTTGGVGGEYELFLQVERLP
jgi:hypothetical protein